MKNSTNTRIALVHLTSRVKQTIIAMLSVTFGVSMYIVMNSFMSGVNDTQTELAFSTLAHIRIYNDGEKDRVTSLATSFGINTIVHVRNPKSIHYTEGIKNSAKIIDDLKKYPDIPTRFRKELEYAYGIARYYRARYFVSKDDRKSARQELRKNIGLDIRYIVLLLILFLPKNIWDIAHKVLKKY